LKSAAFLILRSGRKSRASKDEPPGLMVRDGARKRLLTTRIKDGRLE
jgi:hypothetical protein